MAFVTWALTGKNWLRAAEKWQWTAKDIWLLAFSNAVSCTKAVQKHHFKKTGEWGRVRRRNKLCRHVLDYTWAQILVLQLPWCNEHHCWKEAFKPQCFHISPLTTSYSPSRYSVQSQLQPHSSFSENSPLKSFITGYMSVANWCWKPAESVTEYTCLQVLGLGC